MTQAPLQKGTQTLPALWGEADFLLRVESQKAPHSPHLSRKTAGEPDCGYGGGSLAQPGRGHKYPPTRTTPHLPGNLPSVVKTRHSASPHCSFSFPRQLQPQISLSIQAPSRNTDPFPGLGNHLRPKQPKFPVKMQNGAADKRQRHSNRFSSELLLQQGYQTIKGEVWKTPDLPHSGA